MAWKNATQPKSREENSQKKCTMSMLAQYADARWSVTHDIIVQSFSLLVEAPYAVLCVKVVHNLCADDWRCRAEQAVDC